jgi:hypothetical protein
MKEEQWLVKGHEVVLKAHVSTITIWAKVETLLDNTTLQSFPMLVDLRQRVGPFWDLEWR